MSAGMIGHAQHSETSTPKLNYADTQQQFVMTETSCSRHEGVPLPRRGPNHTYFVIMTLSFL